MSEERKIRRVIVSESRHYGAAIASAIFEQFGASLPPEQTPQITDIVLAATANYMEILRRSGKISPELVLIAADSARDGCSEQLGVCSNTFAVASTAAGDEKAN